MLRQLLGSIAVFGVALSGLAAEVTARPFDLKAKDGTKLKATLYGSERQGPAIMLFHQCNRDRSSWDQLARMLAESGFQVLAMDYRGYGESGGTRFNDASTAERAEWVNTTWPADIDVALEYLRSQPGVQKGSIGAAGASCGVNQSIQLARRHPEVRSLVLLSGGTNREGRRFLRGTNIPVLTSAAADDGNAIAQMQWLTGTSVNPASRLVRYDAGGHGTEMFNPHPDLPKEIVKWFDTTLRGPTAPVVAAKRVANAAATAANSGFLAALDEPNGVPAARQIFDEARAQGRLPAGFDEAIVNQLGYERLNDKDAAGAVEILKMNVEAFPKSANAYDSLGDAYEAAGQLEPARENAQKCLALLSDDAQVPEAQRQAIRENAERKLQPGTNQQ